MLISCETSTNCVRSSLEKGNGEVKKNCINGCQGWVALIIPALSSVVLHPVFQQSTLKWVMVVAASDRQNVFEEVIAYTSLAQRGLAPLVFTPPLYG